ncbi:MAG: hypothetical protein OJF51_000759 [Nitrospira sp.]|nr:MAG: hypothetical protein OJF51_000759 [Nitrospira sp.]
MEIRSGDQIGEIRLGTHESKATMKNGDRIDRADTIIPTLGAGPDDVASRSRRLP